MTMKAAIFHIPDGIHDGDYLLPEPPDNPDHWHVIASDGDRAITIARVADYDSAQLIASTYREALEFERRDPAYIRSMTRRGRPIPAIEATVQHYRSGPCELQQGDPS